MKRHGLLTGLIMVGLLTSLRAHAVTVTVPGTSDPWLAGMPNGSPASGNDFAPGQSPVFVMNVQPGELLTWTASGLVGHPMDEASPDGALYSIVHHDAGAENGISDIITPIDSLLGVFLGPDVPNLSVAPGALDFSSSASRDYLTLSPELKQVFFMGDGQTDTSIQQYLVVPSGATRLFLGTMDGFEWNNNTGAFEVTVNSVPDGGFTLALMGSMFGLIGLIRRKIG